MAKLKSMSQGVLVENPITLDMVKAYKMLNAGLAACAIEIDSSDRDILFLEKQEILIEVAATKVIASNEEAKLALSLYYLANVAGRKQTDFSTSEMLLTNVMEYFERN